MHITISPKKKTNLNQLQETHKLQNTNYQKCWTHLIFGSPCHAVHKILFLQRKTTKKKKSINITTSSNKTTTLAQNDNHPTESTACRDDTAMNPRRITLEELGTNLALQLTAVGVVFSSVA